MNETLNAVMWILLGVVVIVCSYKIGVRDGDIDSTNKMRNLELLSQSMMLSEQNRIEEIANSIGGITSVNISPLRYVELIRAEKELKELRNE